MFPGSAREAEAPGQEFAHMMNTYRQALGITRIDHRGADRLAAGGGGDCLDQKTRQEAMRHFNQNLDVMGLVDDMVRDINQPTGAAERRIDRDGFAKWAGEHDSVSHRIFFDEEASELYLGTRPLKNDKVDDSMHPFIHRALAIEILQTVLVQDAGE